MQSKSVTTCHMKHQQADQPTKKYVTSYQIQVSPLLDCHSWKQLIFKSVHICKMFYACYRAHYVLKVMGLWLCQRYFISLCIRNIHIYIHTQYMYNGALVYKIHLLHPLCAQSGYGPVCLSIIFFVYIQ